MSQNESTTFLVTDAKNLTLIDANRENSPWCFCIIMSCVTIAGVHFVSGATSGANHMCVKFLVHFMSGVTITGAQYVCVKNLSCTRCL